MSSNSGNIINYSVRPAKNVERKMIRDLFLRLRSFGELTNFQYIGFGAKYFVDFVMFHKHLHIKKMISIEKDRGNVERYEFNKPFGCIDIKNEQSNDALSKINYDKKVICWLDYDGVLTNNVLTDVVILLENAKSGSTISVSYNSHPYQPLKLKEKYGDDLSQSELILKELGCSIRKEMLPTKILEQGTLKRHNFSKILRSIIFNQIDKTLLNKNAGLKNDEKWIFSQIMFFDYKDGAYMSTIGGVLYQKCDEELFNNCSFDSFDFYKSEDESYSIEVPNLTIKEINRLRENMPLTEFDIDNQAIFPKTIFSEADILKFSKIYKYFPSFSEVESA